MSKYARSFYACKSCGFLFTTLTQENLCIDGACPSCGNDNIDYASKTIRNLYAQDLFEELYAMVTEDLR